MKSVDRTEPLPVRSDPTEPSHPLVEADRLRVNLSEATQRAGRLVTRLKSRRREQKALATVSSSLKSRNLRPSRTASIVPPIPCRIVLGSLSSRRARSRTPSVPSLAASTAAYAGDRSHAASRRRCAGFVQHRVDRVS